MKSRRSGAGAGELKQRSLELAADNGVVSEVFLDGDVLDHVVEYGLHSVLALSGNHLEGVGLTNADTNAASHTIEGRNSEGVLVNTLPLPSCQR